MNPLASVAVRGSSINGTGVFALTAYAPGEIILAIDDSYVVDSERPVPVGEDVHCDYLEQGKVVWMQAPERYINHCCEPNSFVLTVDGVRKVAALREIQAGDEITYDYCINGYGDTIWTCSCGAARCRRSIHSDFFHLPIQLQHKYLPLLDDWFRIERASDIAKLMERGPVPPSNQ